MTSTLAGVRVEIADLGGNRLGEAVPGLIRLDVDAAGIGWFVDLTPGTDEEFEPGSLAAVMPQAQGGVDLLTVLLHELGHQLGMSDLGGGIAPSNFMAETLTPGQRRLPTEDDLDLLFSNNDLLDSVLS